MPERRLRWRVRRGAEKLGKVEGKVAVYRRTPRAERPPLTIDDVWPTWEVAPSAHLDLSWSSDPTNVRLKIAIDDLCPEDVEDANWRGAVRRSETPRDRWFANIRCSGGLA